MYEVTQEDVDHKIVVPESLRRSDWIIDESTSYPYLFYWQTNTRQDSVDIIYQWSGCLMLGVSAE